MSELTLTDMIGDPLRLDADLHMFRRVAELLSSKRLNLPAKYPKRWVAFYDGQVRADARSLRQLLIKVEELKLPRERVAVQYVDRVPRRMIL